MTQRSPARVHQSEDTAPRLETIQPEPPASTSGPFTALLESATERILAVTYWFDPAPQQPEPYAVTIRFSGRRADVEGPLRAGDRFVQEETIEKVVPGCGPVSVTTRVHGINPGRWAVTAQVQGRRRAPRGRRERKNVSLMSVSARAQDPLLARVWRSSRWAPVTGSSLEAAEPVHTCFFPFARVPGIVPGIWSVMVTLGMVVALAIQALVITRDHLAVGSGWVVALAAIAAGIIGAKGWFIVLHRRERRLEGWCIQGFIVAATVTAAVLLVALRVPAGVFLDAMAPGLLFGMAIGRVGCFFAGCCGGPLTASRRGVWSSDQRIGGRRIPTQLLESALALGLGLGALVAVLRHGPAGGAFFVAALAAYTLGRQGILRLRAELRKTRWGGVITAVLAALILVTTIVFIVR